MLAAVALLLPTTCPACARPGPAPCPRCVSSFGEADVSFPLPPLVGYRALFAYGGAARRVVTRLKYANNRGAVAWLGVALSGLVDVSVSWQLTWVPTSPARVRARGFDQAELLARAVSRASGLPVTRLLARVPGPPQTGRHRDERVVGPHLVLRRRPEAGRPVLLVDDVITTGATVQAAAGALLAGGAGPVGALVVAVTPRRQPAPPP